jgi:hypothetical protein
LEPAALTAGNVGDQECLRPDYSMVESIFDFIFAAKKSNIPCRLSSRGEALAVMAPLRKENFA